VHVALATLPLLRATGTKAAKSTLVLVASVAGLRGFPQLAGYSASKFAVLGFAQALRDELAGSGVDLRVLCPPPGDTPMVRDLPQRPPVYKLSRLFTAAEVVDGLLRGLEGDEWILLVDVGSKAMWRAGRVAPGLLDRLVRWASD
jgi:short-subunit dehydrogenase